MKLSITILAVLLMSTVGISQEWAHQIGSGNIDQGSDIAVDISGNSYVAGFFSGTIQLGNNIMLSSAGGRDILVAKYSATGQLLWAKGIGGSGNDEGRGVALDQSGAVYVIGDFAGNVDFDPSIGIALQSAQGATDVFVAKFGSDGAFQQVTTVQGSGADVGQNIEMGAGHFYISGAFDGNLDFTAFSTTDNLTKTSGNQAVFFAKYDLSGVFVWSKKVESPTAVVFTDMAVHNEQLYFTGYYKDTTDFNPSAAGVLKLSPSGNNDAFIAKYNTNGSLNWAKAIHGIDNETGESIHVNIDGNVLVAGYFLNAIDLDPSSAAAFVTSVGQRDLFFAQYTSSGKYRWGKRAGGSDNEYAYAIATDNQRRVFLAGSFQGTADFNPDVAKVNEQTSASGADIFFARYDSIGNYEWSSRAGGTNGDLVQSIVANNVNEIYCTGWFQGNATFFTNQTLTSAGDRDLLVAKINTNSTTSDNSIWNAVEVSIFPNPLERHFYLKISNVVLKKTTLTVTNLLGQTVFEQQLSADELSATKNIYLPETIATGLYLVTIREGNIPVFTEKVLLK